MSTGGNSSSFRSTNLMECFVVFFVVGIIGLIVLASLAPRAHSRKSTRIICVSNLKQVGLALKMYATDYGNKYPWEISTNESGVMEWARTKSVFLSYRILSNELASPKLLLCPMDTMRKPGTDWANLTNNNLSYFISRDARTGDPLSPIFGDRNLAVRGYQLGNGTYYIPTQKVVTWSSNIHVNAGNMAFSDGSANMINDQKLQKAFNVSGRASNSISIP